MTILTRKDAWKLSASSTWEPTLLWYAKAVGEMSSRPATDPTSWRYQAGIHGYKAKTDPFAAKGPVPGAVVRRKFWGKCQHGTWFFLPWHRMYLGYFERIVRAAVVKLGGPSDWTLPYWNYSDTSNPTARALPPAFREKKLPDGAPNPLYTIDGIDVLRAPGVNAGKLAVLPPADVAISGCLAETFFSPKSDVTTGDLGFGGPATAANHDGTVFGPDSVETRPHNAVHVDVGGQWTQGGKTFDGWMIDPDTAALDPIFWVHHANIDRLWSVWKDLDPAHANPSGSVNVHGKSISWATAVKFAFHDETGAVVSLTPGQMVDTRAKPFFYDYDDTKSPVAATAGLAAIAAGSKAVPKQIPEMLGANAKKATLTGAPSTVSFSLQPPAGPAKARTAAAALPGAAKTYLQVENVVSKSSRATYEVFVNLPEKPTSGAYERHLAGAMHLFGVVQASRLSEEHAGDGLNFSLDITDLVDRLKATGDWDEKNVRVTFVPRGAGNHRAIPEHDPIKIGRVSVYRSSSGR